MKFSVFCGVSVDGFIARPDDTFDFLSVGEGESEDEPHGFTEFLSSVDVIVMGRRTFEVVRDLGHIGLYGDKPVIVLSSRTLELAAVDPTIEQMAGTPSAIAAQLKERGWKHAYVDGGITIQRFLDGGLIDRITITRVPVLIGQGIPLFGKLPHDVRLLHVATRSYKDGMVQSEYEVVRAQS